MQWQDINKWEYHVGEREDKMNVREKERQHLTPG